VAGFLWSTIQWANKCGLKFSLLVVHACEAPIIERFGWSARPLCSVRLASLQVVGSQ